MEFAIPGNFGVKLSKNLYLLIFYFLLSQEPPQEGYKTCTKCPEEMFTFQPGSREPDQCREKCSPGYYSPTGLAPCAPCPLHHFQPLSGERQCFQCQSGEETRTTGAASKDDCRAVNCDSGNLCENGGECVPIQHRAKCYCPAGFTGQYCEVSDLICLLSTKV